MDRVLFAGRSDHEDAIEARLSAAFAVDRADDLAGTLERLESREADCLLLGATGRPAATVVERVRRPGHALPVVTLAAETSPSTTDVAAIAPPDDPDAVAARIEEAIADHRTDRQRRVRRRQRAAVERARAAVADADGHDAALDALCRALTDGPVYDAAWVGRVDGEALRPVAAAGVPERHLGSVRVDGETDTPAAWAVTTESVAATGEQRPTVAVPLGEGPVAVLHLVGDRHGGVSRSERTELADLSAALGGLFGADARDASDRLAVLSDTFAHELANQLDVAGTHLELARERGDDSHFEHVGDALARLTSLVEESRLLARGDLSTEPVDVRETAETAWAGVDTSGATLEVDDGSVEADADLLGLLLVNLLRNCVEHGSTGSQRGSRADDSVEHGSTGSRPEADDSVEHGSGVTVEVGPTDEGLYVADDGPGIPPDERDKVFEWGYSTGGTGAGLGIVALVAERHGWSVEVAESEAGGARFEVS